MIDLKPRPSPSTLTALVSCDACGRSWSGHVHMYFDSPAVPRAATAAVRAAAATEGWTHPDGVDQPDFCAACSALARGEREAMMAARLASHAPEPDWRSMDATIRPAKRARKAPR
jgi:hypothetical protein